MRRRFVAIVLAAGCGGGGGKTPDAATAVDASPDAALPILKLGAIELGEEVMNGGDVTVSIVAFARVLESDSIRADGPCSVDMATRGNSAFDGAGTVTITYGSGQSLQLVDDGMGGYSNIAQQYLYAPGDTITVSGTGAVVPAFTMSLTFPSQVTVTSPTSLSVLHQSGITATWTATSSPVHIRINQYLANSHAVFIDCTYAGDAGSGAVPASALTDLVPGASASFTLLTESVAMTAVGDYATTAQAVFVGYTANPNPTVAP